MSRRKLYWREHYTQSQDLNKIIPVQAVGNGTYWTKMAGANHGPRGKGEIVTRSMSNEMEAKVRQWASRWK